MDVDGVLTDGKIYYLPGPKGEFVESKTFHSRDGAGIRLAHLGGIKTGFITGRESGVVSHRAKELGIHYLYQAAGTKGSSLDRILKASGFRPTRSVSWGTTSWTCPCCGAWDWPLRWRTATRPCGDKCIM